MIQETLREKAKRVVRTAAPVVAAVGLLAGGCAPDVGGLNLLDCEAGPKTNSTSLFIGKEQEIRVGRNVIRITTNPAGIELKAFDLGKFQFVSGADIITIKDISDTRTVATFSDNHKPGNFTKTITLYDGSKTFALTGKPASQGDINGTELDIQAKCVDEK